MYSSLILIVNDPKNIEVCKNKLHQDSTFKIETTQTEDETLESVKLLEPDIILLSTNFNEFDGYSLCKKIREIIFITRPVIVMISNKENEDTSERIEGLRVGADDYLHLSLSEEEFSVRIYAHLRRHIEALSDQTTRLPNSNIINTNLKRKINLKTPWALMLISLNNFQPYNDTYGYLAGSQLLKAFVAITKANMQVGDIIGHISSEEFAIICNPMNAELIAERICRTFDKIVPKFYAPFEAERGFTIITDEERASRKVPLVSVSIGIVSNSYRHLDNYKTAISIANNMKELAKHQIGSGWLLDRPLLSGDEYSVPYKDKPYILVVEPDAALAYLLTTTLEMEGYFVDATSNKEEAINFIKNQHPNLVLIDAVIPGDDGWEICTYIRENETLKNTKIIMATVLHDKEKAFMAGADIYIPKPYELWALHKWINKLISDLY